MYAVPLKQHYTRGKWRGGVQHKHSLPEALSIFKVSPEGCVLQSITIQTSRHAVWLSDLIVLEIFMRADLCVCVCLYIIVVSRRGCKPEAYFLYC